MQVTRSLGICDMKIFRADRSRHDIVLRACYKTVTFFIYFFPVIILQDYSIIMRLEDLPVCEPRHSGSITADGQEMSDKFTVPQ